jgi:hypothetical protein
MSAAAGLSPTRSTSSRATISRADAWGGGEDETCLPTAMRPGTDGQVKKVKVHYRLAKLEGGVEEHTETLQDRLNEQ